MYQVLARKYRPRNFNELVGQNHVSRALTSALERGRLHHAYLFTGTRGVGKTTIARILAKCLNCETGITSTPCETCPTCNAVNEGRFIDLIEIDAASRTKVEDTRELLDAVPYAPTQGRFKVYLIDEVHMLSTHSFNALLKTLEEPPEHVKFLFATTDPQKLPVTVISRCLQFTLRPLDITEISQHLVNTLNKENITYNEQALWQIAEAAQGSLRDALSLTDQAIAYGQGEIHQQDVKDMLGLIDKSLVYDLILAIHHHQAKYVSELLLTFRQQALDVSLVLDQVISTLHELALMQHLPALNLSYSQEINQKIKQLALKISASDLQLYYQIACKGRSELAWAVTQEQGFEMCILRMLAFRPLQVTERPILEQSELVNQETAITLPEPEPEPRENWVKFTSDGLIEVDVPSYHLQPKHIENDLAVFPFSLESENLPQSILQLKQQDLVGEWTVAKWEYWFRNSELSPAVQELAQYGVMTGTVNAKSIFIIPKEYEQLLTQQQHNLERALKNRWEKTIFVVQYKEVKTVTPYMLQQQRKEKAYQKAVELIKSHSVVHDLLHTFDGDLKNVKLKQD